MSIQLSNFLTRALTIEVACSPVQPQPPAPPLDCPTWGPTPPSAPPTKPFTGPIKSNLWKYDSFFNAEVACKPTPPKPPTPPCEGDDCPRTPRPTYDPDEE